MALAVIIAVAASLAIRGSQHKISESRAKEANIEAKLVLDSAASRLLSHLDRIFEIKGAYSGGELQQWISSQQAIISEPYKVDFSITNEVLPEAKTIFAREMARSSATKNPVDPLYPDFEMNRTNLFVDITARSFRPGYPDFKARYTFQIRAIPVTEWTVFNPGQHRENVILTKDASDSEHAAAYAYAGTILSGGFTASGTPAQSIEASATDPNHRLWRSTGVAKYQNAASLGVLSFHGDYPASEPDWGSYETWGEMHSSTDGAVNDAILTTYSTILNGITTAKPIGTTPNYSVTQISVNNPLFEPNGQDKVAMLNLADYLAESTSINGNYVIPPPDTSGLPIHTIVVTNASALGTPSDTINLTFPPSVRVFFADDVNTNRARLKVEGNIGFIPTGVNVIQITNYTGNQRMAAPVVYSTNEFRLVTREDVTLDTTNESFVAHQRYMQMHQQLYRWATNIQARLLSDPASPLFVANADQENFFLDFLSISNLNSTVKPLISQISDVSTNQTRNIYTNVLNRYNYAGFYFGGQVCGLTQERMVALDTSLTDSHMANVTGIPGSFLLNSLEIKTNSTVINQPFADSTIQMLNAKLPALTRNYTIEATLTGWNPTNLAVLFPVVAPGNIDSLPYAKAYITIHTNYAEKYREEISVLQPTGDLESLGTNGPIISRVDPAEVHPFGGTWRNYLWNSWSSGITRAPYLGMLIRSGQDANSERYDVNGVWNTNNFGAWKVATTDVLEDYYAQTAADGRSDADIAAADPSYYNNTFATRFVRFNYQTSGWTKTNLVEIPGPAPAFYGRLVVEDGIKRLSGYPPENLTIHGQVSYTHRIKALPETDLRVTQYSVNHNRNTIPRGPDRVFDIRIAHIDLNRL